jgi:hypothetical protein
VPNLGTRAGSVELGKRAGSLLDVAPRPLRRLAGLFRRAFRGAGATLELAKLVPEPAPLAVPLLPRASGLGEFVSGGRLSPGRLPRRRYPEERLESRRLQLLAQPARAKRLPAFGSLRTRGERLGDPLAHLRGCGATCVAQEPFGALEEVAHRLPLALLRVPERLRSPAPAQHLLLQHLASLEQPPEERGLAPDELVHRPRRDGRLGELPDLCRGVRLARFREPLRELVPDSGELVQRPREERVEVVLVPAHRAILVTMAP